MPLAVALRSSDQHLVVVWVFLPRNLKTFGSLILLHTRAHHGFSTNCEIWQWIDTNPGTPCVWLLSWDRDINSWLWFPYSCPEISKHQDLLLFLRSMALKRQVMYVTYCVSSPVLSVWDRRFLSFFLSAICHLTMDPSYLSWLWPKLQFAWLFMLLDKKC
jgi:hypothetical protein